MPSLLVLSCQGSPLKDFSSLKVGMEKGEVLDAMGSPNRTQRFHGKDRWTYIFYENGVRYEKEVHLDAGKAVYVGDIWSPPAEKSAETADSENATAHNANLEAIENRSKENKSKSFSDYEKKVKGEDKVHYLPTYKQIK
jgi:outer membrane protein assembly factor BamE